ncbi:two-component system VirA-like sensor kinase [Bradyrhizobium sp. CB2312]|uniref:two-component system VirA-like sensor kinase n=1 Tax=Bradyrhizobium sp. CB2312 TaxID=3039155 RepID=UPI0024B2069F|nr:two-component system VirA-like sensor kinase [Bradyrhizobium sp. CB2312]WFU69931.1 two-component system VirA-like sensor kinase [Bradyrhizobium sp. CB2312]
MKLAPAMVGVAFLLALLTWLLLNGLNLNSDRYDRQTQALSDFTRFERGISREVLTSRAGLSRNYDGLVAMVDAYDAALVRLREAAGTDKEQLAAIDVLSARATRQEELIEQFKSKNALLRNSFTYFSLFSARLSSSDDRPLVADVSALSAAMLQLTLDTSDVTAGELQSRLDHLARLQIASQDNELLHAAVAHGQLLHDLLPDVDAILKALVAEANNREQDAVHALIVKRQISARVAARKNRLLQYVTSLMLLGALVYFGLLLRARAKALRRRAAFEHVIANISMRFIDSHRDALRSHVESALEELAGFIGADRAYFAWSAAATDNVYRWGREGVRFDATWPSRALDLAQRFDDREEAIIYIPKVWPSHPDDLANLLDEAGIRGWLCIKTQSGREHAAILGFDAVRAPALSKWAEFALFRTAFDAIRNAVGRVVLEQEKERLQASLQQARRMETIGTFASGIAHNFNNIVGAILGYVEMADNGIKSGSRSAASLAEIRRAGERARELVGQILTFGRRSQGRQERICIGTLVAETEALLAASLPAHVRLVVSQRAENITVSGEPAQLQQVILNLCNNAAQAMEEPGVIDLQIAERDIMHPLSIGRTELRRGRFAVISVSDPGPGMDEATLEQVFEPFFTTRSEGNGLGLATVREIVEQHGGAVVVQSTLGAGTRFDIWLPCGSPDEPISVQLAPSLALRGAGETVLVLEADRKRLLRNEEILAALGYEPVGFSRLDDAEAACRAARTRFDVALVCHVPGGSSLDLAYLLHDAAPGLPIILASPSVHHFAAPLLATAGVTELVHHPLMSAELAAALSRCLTASAAGKRAKRIASAG